MNDRSPQHDSLSVTLVARRYDPLGGGAERWLHQHAQSLLRAGHDVTVVAERLSGLPAGVRPIVVPCSKSITRHGCWVFARESERAAAEVNADVTVGMGCSTGCDVVIPHYGTRAANERARMALRSPVQRLLRASSHALLPRNRRLHALEAAVLGCPRVRKVVAVSNMTAGHLQRDTGVDRRKIQVVHNGVDIDWFTTASPQQRSLARARLGFDDRPVCLMVAHDFALKGVANAVRAVARLTHRSPNAAPLLVIVGRDPARPIMNRAKALGVADSVRIDGHCPDVRAHYHAADVLVHPTFYDPCSLVALEAVASGLPVITTTCNGAVEVLRPGVDSLLLPEASDHSALADLMMQAVEPHRNQSLRVGAAQSRSSLCLERPFAQMLGIYYSIKREKRPGLVRGGEHAATAASL